MNEPAVRVQRPYGTFTKISLWTGVGVLVLALLLQWVGVNPVLVWILGSILGGSALLMAAIMYFMSGRMYKELQTLVAGGAWATWQYDPDEWVRFMESEWRRTRKTAFWLALLIPVIGLAFLSISATGMFVGALVTTLLWAAFYFGMQQYYAKQQAAAGVALIGPNGCYVGTTYTSWTGMSGQLRSIQLKEGDPYLVEFEVVVNSGESVSINTIRVAVPRGCETEAAALVQRFYGPAQA